VLSDPVATSTFAMTSGSQHLVIAGMAAKLCCESTGRHAMEKGFDVTFLSDAIGAASIPGWSTLERHNR